MKKILMYCIVVAGVLLPAQAQKVALKSNLVSWGTLFTPNLSVETALSDRWTLDLHGQANFFFYSRDASSPKYETRKWSHWMLQPELRYWDCDVFNGFFYGMHMHFGATNVGRVDIPFILNKHADMREHRYESYFYGAGAGIGYQWVLSKHFNFEGSLGVGFAHIVYDKFKCETCGDKIGGGNATYVGPTKATLSLVYLF